MEKITSGELIKTTVIYAWFISDFASAKMYLISWCDFLGYNMTQL